MQPEEGEGLRSPLAEGRELKCLAESLLALAVESPLAEGRELKYLLHRLLCYYFIRVAPRGGA